MSSTYPNSILFDIETLVNAVQPQRILLVGNQSTDFLASYLEQKQLLNQTCHITHIKVDKLGKLSSLDQRFDVGIAIEVFEHIDKTEGQRLLSKLRDVLCTQYCISLPITHVNKQETWGNTDLFAFALSQVSCYENEDENRQYAVYKYDLNNYKHTPDWLNADNWANPDMWNKYRW